MRKDRGRKGRRERVKGDMIRKYRLNFECWLMQLVSCLFLSNHQQNQKVSMSLEIASPHTPHPHLPLAHESQVAWKNTFWYWKQYSGWTVAYSWSCHAGVFCRSFKNSTDQVLCGLQNMKNKAGGLNLKRFLSGLPMILTLTKNMIMFLTIMVGWRWWL